MLSNLTLKNAAAGNVTYTKLSTKGDTSSFEAAGGSEVTGTSLIIKQGLGGKGIVTGTTVKRTLASFRMRKYNATIGKSLPFTLNLTLTGVVDGTDITAAVVADGIAAARELLLTYQSNLLAGEL